MRLFLVLILVGLISGAGAGWWPRESRESEEMAEALRLKAEADLGIRRMLRGHDGFAFRDIVVGRVHEGGQVDFRGQLVRKGRAEAAYGLVSARCAETLATAGCWQLDVLEVGGAKLALAGPAGPQTPRDANLTTVSSVHPGSSEQIRQAESARRPSTHKVARPVINTRSGPGTDNPVMTQLNAGARLSLIGTKGGWGNFVILDGSAGGQEVWAALSLLEEDAQ